MSTCENLEGFTSISLLSLEISFLTSAKSLISSCDFNGKVVSFVQLTKRKAKQQTPDKITQVQHRTAIPSAGVA